MGSTIRHITFDCAPPHEPYELARFWGQVLDLPVDADDSPGDDEVGLDTPAGQVTLLFVRVPEAKTLKNRVHLDLEPGRSREEEVERVLALGGVIVDDRRKPNGRGWVVFADPAGNEFCIEASQADRAAVLERERAAGEAE
ncbi:VOC family protein [Embleya scabrispora]|uniref:VOC family protein n=1 Tax=Embleya scabrispora TaxID=159449 RepID=UPI0003671310|nr:VOC family protein [Embleya scabrispora]MYS80189.1 VOC family protein [Streptomyces sp. SID5474]